jgi:hypothetical protein
MLKIDDLINWIENYDDIKYPTEIYNELIVEGKEYQNKISLMGAWKTGSLRINEKGKEYTDKNGISYMFTNRWNRNTPVGFEVWNYISNNQDIIKSKIPKIFPQEKPHITIELQDKKGFGFIWSIFVLHCFYPKIYPLFDQHVYRAYKFLVSDGKEITKFAPDDWNEYMNYKVFFSNILSNINIHYSQLDRALWAYGKHLKQGSIIIEEKQYNLDSILNHDKINNTDDNNWIYATTLGGKAKSFWWKINNNFTIYIKRKFKNSISYTSVTISREDLEEVDEMMKHNQWVNLSNNVEKLKNSTEKNGLGKFLYEVLNWQVANAQLASQLAVIFSLSGAWKYNGLKRGMQFKKNNIDWKDRVMTYYLAELSDNVL